MESKDLELLESLSKSNLEVNRLLSEHEEFETRLGSLNKRHARIPKEEDEMLRLKRLKLQGRDRMEQLLGGHRS